MWRRQVAAVRSSQREGPFGAVVVLPVVAVIVVLVLAWLSCEPVAAAAAVAMPANASSSPQARIERRKTLTSQVDCKSEAERAGDALGRAPLGAAYAIVPPRVATASTLVRR